MTDVVFSKVLPVDAKGSVGAGKEPGLVTLRHLLTSGVSKLVLFAQLLCQETDIAQSKFLLI